MSKIIVTSRYIKPNSHGLFFETDKPLVLDRVAKEAANHDGAIWTHIVSLKRDDAERMGYTDLDHWHDLVRRHIVDIAIAQKIAPENIHWYAAFHNKETNPHVHIVVYSDNPHEGYLTNTGIEKIRSSFANDIYKDELEHHSKLRQICLCTDDDGGGLEAAERLRYILAEKGDTEIFRLAPQQKDWNEQFKQRYGTEYLSAVPHERKELYLQSVVKLNEIKINPKRIANDLIAAYNSAD